MNGNGLVALVVVTVLSGCAGLHHIPPADFNKLESANTVRVFFDQHGDVYPKIPPAAPPTQRFVGFNRSFTVTEYLKETRQAERSSRESERINEVASEVKEKIELSSSGRLYILIHGYNNSYEDASATLGEIKEQLEKNLDETPVFLEVYWDGLYKGPISFPYPLWYWFDSMAYSNIAGEIGLRKVLNRLPEKTDVVFVTHSRGAGVAISSLSEPEYSESIKRSNPERINGERFGSVIFLMLAPAIGNGHSIVELKKSLPEKSAMLVGFNENDPALRKSLVGEGNLGDTSLGVNNEFFTNVASKVNQRDSWLQRFIFENHKDHSASGYLSHNEGQAFQCMIWAIYAERLRPEGCSLQPVFTSSIRRDS